MESVIGRSYVAGLNMHPLHILLLSEMKKAAVHSLGVPAESTMLIKDILHLVDSHKETEHFIVSNLLKVFKPTAKHLMLST